MSFLIPCVCLTVRDLHSLSTVNGSLRQRAKGGTVRSWESGLGVDASARSSLTYVTRARGSHALSAERSAITPFLARPTTKQIIVADTRLTVCILKLASSKGIKRRRVNVARSDGQSMDIGRNTVTLAGRQARG